MSVTHLSLKKSKGIDFLSYARKKVFEFDMYSNWFWNLLFWHLNGLYIKIASKDKKSPYFFPPKNKKSLHTRGKNRWGIFVFCRVFLILIFRGDFNTIPFKLDPHQYMTNFLNLYQNIYFLSLIINTVKIENC